MLNISNFLKKHGINPSLQRIKIYEYLVKSKNHPTVDMIYSELVKEIPTLSKTTVYNTLNLFLEKEIIKIVTIEENEVRYDGDITFHGHFKCEECGRIYDFKLEGVKDNEGDLEGFRIKNKDVYYRGKCKHCQKIN